MTWTWSCCTSCWALVSAVDGLFWSSRMYAWTGWPLMPPAAFVASTQSWKTVLASAVDPEATPEKVPSAPTRNGAPLAVLPDPVLLPELDDELTAPAELDEAAPDLDEQPAAARATMTSAGTAARVNRRDLLVRILSLR